MLGLHVCCLFVVFVVVFFSRERMKELDGNVFMRSYYFTEMVRFHFSGSFPLSFYDFILLEQQISSDFCQVFLTIYIREQ